MNLDRLDQQLISALEDDGRRPYPRHRPRSGRGPRLPCGRGWAVLWTRASSALPRWATPLRLGVNVVAIALIQVKPGAVQGVAETLKGYPNVRFVGTSFGAADIIIQTLHADVKALHRFVSQELPRAAPDIIRTETFQLAEVLKSSWEVGVVYAGGAGGAAGGAGGEVTRRLISFAPLPSTASKLNQQRHHHRQTKKRQERRQHHRPRYLLGVAAKL